MFKPEGVRCLTVIIATTKHGVKECSLLPVRLVMMGLLSADVRAVPDWCFGTGRGGRGGGGRSTGID